MSEIYKEIFLDELPKKIRGGKEIISWKDSIGYKVKFIYDDTEGKLEIVDYSSKKQKIFVKYKDNEAWISSQNLKDGNIYKIINSVTSDFKVDIWTMFSDDKRNITIIDKEYRFDKNNQRRKWKYYKYCCNKCGYEHWLEESNLICHKVGCSRCAGKSLYIGTNDIATVAPYLTKFLVHKDDAYKYTANSDKKVKVKCPICNNYECDMIVSNLNNQGFSCKSCGDGISYPEKVTFNVLKQIFDFISQYSSKDADWCGKYRYDFYIPYLNCIIEVHGLQHYEDTSWSKYVDVHKNDTYKKELALKNGIKHYISIDCRKSDIDYIKNSIIKSLSGLINLDSIDWKLVEEQSLDSFVKEVCDIKKENSHYTTGNISKITHLSVDTVREYLKKGTKLEWCSYDSKNNTGAGGQTKTIVCLNDNYIFQSISSAAQHLSIDASSISSVCQGKRKSAGKHQKTGEPLRWMYYEDYLKLHSENNALEVVNQ